MDLFLRVDINFISIAMLSLIFMLAYRRLDRKHVLNQIYLSTILVLSFGLFIEAMTVIINGREAEIFGIMSNVLHVFLYSIAPIVAFAWYLLIRNFTVTKDHLTLRQKQILFIPAIFSIVTAILSPFFGFVFTVSPDNVYSRGILFPVAVMIVYMYLLLGIIYVIQNRKNLMLSEFFLLIAFGSFPIIGGIAQSLFYGVLLMWSSAAFALVFVYIYLQERLIHLDSLTTAWTRKSFDYYIAKRLRQKNAEPFGGIYFDIDHLKRINDQYGHLEGDQAINEIINRVRGVMNSNEIIARLGGDEFIIISPGKDKERLKNLIKDIQLSLSVFNENHEKPYALSCSYGYGIYSDEYKSIDQFLRFIDHKMYQSKKTTE
jgi:diguanylate cyclase (GGDEF)-like protein